MSHENLKKYNGNKSDFYLSIFRVNNELLVRYFEEKGSGNGGFFRIIKIDLSNENKLLIDKENELKRLCNKLRVIDDKRNVRESRKLLFVYDERRLMPGEESGQLAMIGSKHLSRKQSILLESYHSKNKVLVFRPIENFDQVSDHNRIKFKNSQIVRERYELFEKEMEILPIVLDRHQPVDSLNKEIAYYMKSDRDGYGAGGGGGGGSVGAPNDTFNLKICLYVLKIEVDHKTKNNSIKHIVFLRKEECFQFDDDQTVEQSNEPEMKKRRKQSSKTSHIIRKMYMIQPRNHEFPSEIEIIFKNYNICYVNRTISKSKLEIAYSLSEYDINNNKVDVDELSSQKRTINNESEMSLQKRKQDRSSSSSSSSFNRRNSISTVNFENRTELETIPSEIEHKCETDDHEPKLLAIKPLRYDKNFIEQNRKNVSKIPVLRSGSSSLKYSNMRIKTPKRTPGTNNPMSMLLHAATLKNRDNLKQNSIGKMAKTIAPVATITTTTTTKSVQNNQVGNGVQTKPKDVIEVKLNAKNFFGEGFKDEVVKEIRYLANTIIESKKSKLSDVVHTHNSTIGSMTYPRSVSKLANDEPKKNHTTKSVANKLATPTAAASKGSLPTVYENGKGSSEQLESKRPKTKIVSKINSFRSGSIAGNRTNETRLESQKNSLRSGFVKESKVDSAKNSTKSGSLSAKIKSQTDLLTNVRPATMKITRPVPLTTTSNKSTTHRQFSTKINNSRTCSSIELPKMNTKINQTSYTSLRNVPVKESSRMKRISTAASAINKAETKPNVEKMSIDNLCCENNNSNLNKNGNDESAKEVGVVDGGSIPVADRSAPAATPLTTSKSFRKNQTNCDNSIDMTTTKTTAIGGVKNESIKKISGVEKEVLSGSNQSEEMTSVKQLRKPHFFKKLIKLARKN